LSLTLAGLVSGKLPISLCHKKKNEYLGTKHVRLFASLFGEVVRLVRREPKSPNACIVFQDEDSADKVKKPCFFMYC
jgi:hypothetical protein